MEAARREREGGKEREEGGREGEREEEKDAGRLMEAPRPRAAAGLGGGATAAE
jgi:hypothetical protein